MEETYGKEGSKDESGSGGDPVALAKDKEDVEEHLHHSYQGRVLSIISTDQNACHTEAPESVHEPILDHVVPEPILDHVF